MHPPEAFAGESEQREAVEDLVIEEIDGKPALEVYRSWLSEECQVVFDTFFSSAGLFDPTRFFDWLTFVGHHPIGVPMGKDESGQTVYKQCVANPAVGAGAQAGAAPAGLQLFGGLTVEVGDTLELLTSEDQQGCREKTALTANRVIADAGFDFDSVQGALTVGCGLFWVLGGMDEGLKDLSERMAAAVNWAPTMGILGGPELGPMGEAKAAHAVYTVGCVVFSSKPAKATKLMLTEGQGDGQLRSKTAMFAG
jgi:hypothetical protein